MVRTAGLEVAGLWARNLDVDPAIGAEQVAALDRRRAGRPATSSATSASRAASGWRSSGTRRRAPTRPTARRPSRSIADSVVVVTGGARGIGGQVAVALARRSGCAIELVGRTPLPTEPEPDHLAGAADAAAIRKALIAADGSKRPAEIEAATQHVLARREVDATMAALEGAARSVRYHAVDVRDPGGGRRAARRRPASPRPHRRPRPRRRHPRGQADPRQGAVGRSSGSSPRRRRPSRRLIDGLDADGFAVLFGSVAGVLRQHRAGRLRGGERRPRRHRSGERRRRAAGDLAGLGAMGRHRHGHARAGPHLRGSRASASSTSTTASAACSTSWPTACPTPRWCSCGPRPRR